jgi:hypothetical protein
MVDPSRTQFLVVSPAVTPPATDWCALSVAQQRLSLPGRFCCGPRSERYANPDVRVRGGPAVFETECLDPVREFRLENALQFAPVVSHSIGGLVSAYIQPEGAVYLILPDRST